MKLIRVIMTHQHLIRQRELKGAVQVQGFEQERVDM